MAAPLWMDKNDGDRNLSTCSTSEAPVRVVAIQWRRSSSVESKWRRLDARRRTSCRASANGGAERWRCGEESVV